MVVEVEVEVGRGLLAREQALEQADHDGVLVFAFGTA
jgi:hypothetical protein